MNVVASYRLLIPAVRTVRLIACLVALLACSPLIQAQTDDTDSTAMVEAPLEESNEHVGTKINTAPAPPEYRVVPDSIVHHYQKEKNFEYANDPAYWNTEEEKAERESSYKRGFWDYFNDFFAGGAVRTITYIILIAFFVFVIYRIIAVNKLFYFSSKIKGAAAHAETADIDDDNLDEKIRKAAQTGDHRQAVRYMYLKSLQLLNDRQWIRYHAEATNYEYVIQMSKYKLGNDFGFLTRIYDYVWYGEFALTSEQFETVYNNFSHFYNAVNS